MSAEDAWAQPLQHGRGGGAGRGVRVNKNAPPWLGDRR